MGVALLCLCDLTVIPYMSYYSTILVSLVLSVIATNNLRQLNASVNF